MLSQLLESDPRIQSAGSRSTNALCLTHASGFLNRVHKFDSPQGISTRRELFDFYDYTVWIEAPYDVRLERGLHHAGQNTLDRSLNDWLLTTRKSP